MSLLGKTILTDAAVLLLKGLSDTAWPLYFGRCEEIAKENESAIIDAARFVVVLRSCTYDVICLVFCVRWRKSVSVMVSVTPLSGQFRPNSRLSLAHCLVDVHLGYR